MNKHDCTHERWENITPENKAFDRIWRCLNCGLVVDNEGNDPGFDYIAEVDRG